MVERMLKRLAKFFVLLSVVMMGVCISSVIYAGEEIKEDPSLVAWYRFDEGKGGEVKERSGLLASPTLMRNC